MITKLEVLGTCPLGQLVKETKIDRFGFYAGHRIFKLVRMDWWLWDRFGEGDKFGYSDYKFYSPKTDLKEVSE